MKKNKNLLFVIIVLISIYFINMIIDYNKKDYLILGANTVVQYKNGNINKIKRYNKISGKKSYEKYNVYEDGSFKEYYVSFDKDEYAYYNVYSLTGERVILKNKLLAYRGDININVFDQKYIEDATSQELSTIKKKVKQKTKQDLDITNFRKRVLDLDNDGLKEKIYYVDNYYSSDDKEFYYYIFIQDENDKIVDIQFNSRSVQEFLTFSSKNIAWIIDFNSNNKYTIVLSEYIGENPIPNYEFYEYESGKIKEIFSK